MNNLPVPILNNLFRLVLGDRPLAYLELDLEGRLQNSGGELDTFGLGSLAVGTSVKDQIDILTGLLDPQNLPIDLPFIEAPSGTISDVHLFLSEDRIWVLFLHAEEKEQKQQAVLQKVNELRLTHHRQSQILNQFLGKEVAERLEEGLESVDVSGERRDLTVMFADIRGFTAFSENSSPEQAFSVLNIYLSAMIPIVLENGGVLDKIIGDEVMAIFGMLPDEKDGPNLALQAALQMLTMIERLNHERKQFGKTQLQIGVGVASGPVSLGVLGSQHRKSITVIGNHVNLAARLQGQAAARQLIIDDTCYNAITDYREYFSNRSVELKGYSEPLEVYCLDLARFPDLAQRIASGHP